MSAVDAGVVFLPRFTTLVGETTFTTAPLDVSRQGGAQFQVFRGPFRTSGGTPSLTLYIEESLDAQTWALGPATPQGIVIQESLPQFFSYSFRLRWFRLRLALAGTDPMVTCWAEGLLRGGDGGLWGRPEIRAASGEVSGRTGGEVRSETVGGKVYKPPQNLKEMMEEERARAQQDDKKQKWMMENAYVDENGNIKFQSPWYYF